MKVVNIKPLSVNRAWKGKRYKTLEYKRWQKDVLNLLPNIKNDFKGDLKVCFVFGFSNSASDVDNPLKTIIDTLQVKYKFDDKQIQELNVKKVKVKKGDEFIKFNIIKLC